MKFLTRKRISYSLIYFVVICLLTFLFFNFIGSLLSLFGVKQYAPVFDQLRWSKIAIPLYIPIIFVVLLNLVTWYLKNHSVLKVLLIILICIFGFLFSILLTVVNDVSFLRVLIKLIQILTSGEIAL